MQTRTWNRAKVLLDEALRLPPHERSAFVEASCPGCFQVRDEVLSLLEAYEADDSFLQHPLVARDSGPLLGESAGNYRLLRQLGRGGMGAVYLAERADGSFEKRVAVKVISQNSPELLATLLSERKILAALEHPHIGRLLDAGLLQDGTPYFVMEFVEGKPIDVYCEERRLPLPDRIKLFLQICEAVDYAHRCGVIHRDLKPANVLVNAEGSPKLLDFGIARQSGIAPEAFGDLSRCTPDFASPEQLKGEAADERTDIYSLGVLLFVLLTRQRPCGQAATTLAEFIEAVHRDPPTKGSRAVLQTGEADQSSAAEAQRWSRCMKGDLDAILAKALEKKAADRYPSVSRFADDLRCFLAKQPVAARRRSVVEKSWAGIRRHGWAAVVAVLLVLFSATGLIVWRKARSGEWGAPRPSLAVLPFTDASGATGESWVDAAITELLQSELAASAQFRLVAREQVLHSLATVGPGSSLDEGRAAQWGRMLSSEYLLTGSTSRQGAKIAVRARLMRAKNRRVIAEVGEEGDEDDLSAMAARVSARLVSMAGVQREGGKRPSASDDVLTAKPAALKLYAQGLVKLEAGDALHSRDFLSKAASLAPLSPMIHAALAKSWAVSGYDRQALEEARLAYSHAGRLSREDRLALEAGWQEAAKDWTKAIRSYQALFSAVPDEIEYGLSLVRVQAAGGKLNDALATVGKLRGASFSFRDDSRVDLAEASVYEAMPNNKRFLELAQRAEAKAKATGFGFFRAQALMAESNAWHALGNYDACLRTARDAQKIYERAEDQRASMVAKNAIANVQYNTGDLTSAKRTYLELLNLSRAMGYDRGTASGLHNLASILDNEGDFQGAIRLNRECVEICRRLNDGERLALGLNNLANYLVDDGQRDLALRTYEEALRISIDRHDILQEAMTTGNIGLIYIKNGDYQRAREAQEKSLQLHRQAGDPAFYAPTLTALAHTNWALGRTKEALANCNEAVDEARKLKTPSDLSYALVRRAGVLHDLGEVPEAIRDIQEAYRIRREVLPATVNATQADLALNILDGGNAQEALRMANEVLGQGKGVLAFDRFSAYLVKAQALAQLHQFETARLCLALAGKTPPKELDTESRIDLALTRTIVARLANQIPEAMELGQEALRLSKKCRLVPQIVASQTELALLSADPQTSRQAADLAGRYRLRFYQQRLQSGKQN